MTNEIQADAKLTGAEMITAERERQVKEEGYTAQQDDDADMGELSTQ